MCVSHARGVRRAGLGARGRAEQDRARQGKSDESVGKQLECVRKKWNVLGSAVSLFEHAHVAALSDRMCDPWQ